MDLNISGLLEIFLFKFHQTLFYRSLIQIILSQPLLPALKFKNMRLLTKYLNNAFYK